MNRSSSSKGVWRRERRGTRGGCQEFKEETLDPRREEGTVFRKILKGDKVGEEMDGKGTEDLGEDGKVITGEGTEKDGEEKGGRKGVDRGGRRISGKKVGDLSQIGISREGV